MLRHALVSVAVWLATFVVLAPTAAQDVPRTPWGTPDLVGIWDFRTVTPLERPKDLADEEFLTDKEAAEFEANFSEGPVYEYACHEGNRSMTVILEVARAQERAEAERD